MSTEAVFTGIAAVVVAAGGIALVVREFRNREHKAARAEIDQLTADLYRIDQAYIEERHYAFLLRQMVADLGGDVPDPPPIHQLDKSPKKPLLEDIAVLEEIKDLRAG